MELILKFAYLRDVSGVNETNVHEMLMTSDFLGVLGLMKFCIKFIIKTMTSENCVILWLMSRYRGIVKLREKSWSYIIANFATVSVKNKDLLELNVEDFHLIISDDMLNVKVGAIITKSVSEN